ncbi:MAG TPA: glycosyltransferase family 2 protein [Candidatus Omnitrophota bacterium]|nr:glycosyltransferase family 2 protein [Candidatus Omnitrophota bacterium]
MPTPKEDITVIVAHHTGDLIKRCLASLPGYDVIVVTTDPAYIKTTERLVIKLGDCPALNNPSYKRNLGVKFTDRKYIAFLDDDTEMLPYTLEHMSCLLEIECQWGMTYATLYKMDDHHKLDTAGTFISWNGFLYEDYKKMGLYDMRPVLASKSACCMVRRDLFLHVGGFDETFFIYGEETDLSWRIWRAGYQVWAIGGAIGFHAFETIYKPKSYYNPYYIHFHGCKNYLTMLLKNLPRRKLYIALFNASAWFTMALLLVGRNKQASKWILQGIWYNIKNFRRIMAKRTGNFNIPDVVWKNPPISYYINRCREYLTHQLHG